jgi:histidine triad (HIT) family protein
MAGSGQELCTSGRLVGGAGHRLLGSNEWRPGEFLIPGKRWGCAWGSGSPGRCDVRHRPLRKGHYDRAVPDCLFCGIAAGQIPATIVLDGKRVIAFRDISPQAPTHVLVVTKDHFPNVAALAGAGDGLLDEIIAAAGEVAAAEGIEASGYRIVFNTGSDGGQTVEHVHAHVLGGRSLSWPPG